MVLNQSSFRWNGLPIEMFRDIGVLRVMRCELETYMVILVKIIS